MFKNIFEKIYQLKLFLVSFIMKHRNNIKIIYFAILCFFSLMHIADAIAQSSGTGFNIPGTDKSKDLTDANDLAATIVGFAENVFSKVIALFCAITGVHKCSKKKSEEGVPLLVGAVGLTFVGRIMDTISNIFGTK